MTIDTDAILAQAVQPEAPAAPQGDAPAPEGTPESQAGEDAPRGDADANDAPEGGEPKAKEVDPTPEPKHAPKSGLQKRIDELTYKAREAERQLEEERTQRLRDQAQSQALQRMQAIDAQEPRIDNYETVSEFAAAHARWAGARTLELTRAYEEVQNAERIAKQAEDGQKDAQNQVHRAAQAQVLEEKLGQGTKKYKDFVEVLTNPDLPSSIGSPLFDAVMASDNAVDIAYALGKNPDEYERLLRLSYRNPAAAFKEVLTLDARFSGASKTTQAPPPPPQLKGSPPVAKRLEDADYDEFVRIRRKQVAARPR